MSCLVGAVCLAALTGCTRVPGFHLRLDDTVRIPDRQVVMFVVDGMDADRAARLIDQRRLPNIRRRFVDRGVWFTHAFGVFPTVTYANCSSIITGRLPDAHGIVGNSWYDPSTATCRDYRSNASYLRVNSDLRVPTLFELLTPRPTLNMRFIMSRGADVNLPLGKMAKILWWFGQYEACDDQLIHRMRKALRLIRKGGAWPVFTAIYMPSVDEIGHRCGPDSPEYTRALENVDRIIGRFIDAYEEAGLDTSTYYILLADHSMVATSDDKRFDLARWFREEAGQRVWAGGSLPDDETKRRATLTAYDMILNRDAGRIARIYLPRGNSESPPQHQRRIDAWCERILPRLLDHPAIDLSFRRLAGGGVRIQSRTGRAEIIRDHGQSKGYTFVQYEGDPLGYRRYAKLRPFLAGTPIPSRLSLSLTAETEYPDLVRQVVELFRSDRAGDVVVTAAGNWTFHSPWKGGHGSALRSDLHIPLYVAGPGIGAGRVDAAACCLDVVPTVLEWLEVDGTSSHLAFDGESLSSRLATVQ